MKLKGNDVLLQVNMGTALSPDWMDVACITANGIEQSSDEIDAGSKCGPETIPGDISWSGSVEGFYELSPSPTQLSGAELIDMAQSQVLYPWRMRNPDMTYYRGFDAIISNYSETADYNDIVSFSADLNVKGSMITTAPTT